MSDDAISFDALLDACTDDPGTHARTAAFALVTAYDHEVSEREIARYVELVGGDGPAFGALATAMKEDLDRATAWMMAVLATMERTEVRVEEILSAGRAAIVADEEIRPREELALRLVAQAIGLDPDDV
ncbi:MAG: TerB family tellurite resistance protein [Sandaracinaceae bacterium]|nr:TerB family tellurite resistance protein [Sandaracinaceae bacterium]